MSEPDGKAIGCSKSAKSRFRKRIGSERSTSATIIPTSTAIPTLQTLSNEEDNLMLSTASNSSTDSNFSSSPSTTDSLDRSQDLFDEYLNECSVSNPPSSSNHKSFRDNLSSWALRCGIKHSATSELLKILSRHGHEHEIPTDARTLLKTPRTADVKDMDIGEFCHFSLKESLSKRLAAPEFEHEDHISININIDGVPLFKSTSFGLWLILGVIVGLNVKSNPFVISVYGGTTKPRSSNQFTKAFVKEMQELERNGLMIGTKVYAIEMGLAIFDSPARCFVLYTKGHTGFHSCSQCFIKGMTYRKRRIFVDTTAKLRSDKNFNKKTDKHYHNGESNLERLKMGMVSQVPLDYLHVVLLGVVKRFCFTWVESDEKLDTKHINKISERLVAMEEFVPREFSRKPRSLLEYRRWKGTEFRAFLLYYSIFVLHGVLEDNKYKHFMCLVVAIRILVSNSSSPKEINYAESILKYFVENAKYMYDEVIYTHNMHNLIHLAANVRKHGPLDDFSAFPFENFMSSIKRMVRKPSAIVAQIYNRCAEQNSNFVIDVVPKFKNATPKVMHKTLDTFQGYQIGKLFYSNSDNNCGIILRNGVYGKLYNFRCSDGEIFFDYNKIDSLKDLFNFPCSSSRLGIYEGLLNETVHTAKVDEIQTKICLFPLNVERTRFSIVPILHFLVIPLLRYYAGNFYFKTLGTK